MIKQLILAATIGLATLPALAVDIAVAPGEAYLRVTEGDKNILFVDVRDPVEIMFVGFADTVHVNALHAGGPERLGRKAQRLPALPEPRLHPPDPGRARPARPGQRRGNHHHVPLRQRAGRAQCRLPARQWVPNARFVIDGFQGPAVKDGPQAGLRIRSGWQNSGLPWSSKMNPEKMYRTDRRP
jgi:hypothetical protein